VLRGVTKMKNIRIRQMRIVNLLFDVQRMRNASLQIRTDSVFYWLKTAGNQLRTGLITRNDQVIYNLLVLVIGQKVQNGDF